jgi:hypothetical protein
MASQTILRWLDGRGWLVLSSDRDTSEMRASALSRASADGGIAVVYLGDQEDGGDVVLDDVEDLGAPSGYLVDVFADDDQTLRDRLVDASVILVSGAKDADAARSALVGAASDGIKAAYQQGAVVMLEGAAASAVGAYLVGDNDSVTSGFGWVENALIAPGVADVGVYARPIMRAHADALAIGVGAGAALALGPDGEVEVWGAQRVAVALGPAYQS